MTLPLPKTKPASRPNRTLLVASARDYAIDAIVCGLVLLNEREQLAFITKLREDLDMRQSEIEYTIEARRRKRSNQKAAT